MIYRQCSHPSIIIKLHTGGFLNFTLQGRQQHKRKTLHPALDAKQFVHIGLSCKHVVVRSATLSKRC